MKLREDVAVPTNNAGSGAIDGIGVGFKGEPGVNQKKKKVVPFKSFLRRKQA